MAMLSLNQCVAYLRDNYPSATISYPTALKLVKSGALRSIRVGSTHKIHLDELHRFATQGNYVEDQLQIAPKRYAAATRKVISDELDPTT